MTALRGCPPVLSQIQEKIRGQTRPGINGGLLKELAIPLPPLSEQQEIMRRVGEIGEIGDRTLRQIDSAAVRVERSTQAVLAKAFRGQLT